MQVFRVNGLYDPDQTGTGAQPVYFDQWMALYNRYRVLGMWIDAKFSNVDGQHVMAAAATGLSASGFGSLVTLDVAGMRNSISSEAHSGGPLGRLCRFFSVARSYGVHERAVKDEDYFAGDASNNPHNQVYLGIGMQTSGNTDTCWLAGRLIYDVRFEAPLMRALSTRVLTNPSASVIEGLLTQPALHGGETVTRLPPAPAAPVVCRCAGPHEGGPGDGRR
jgi:hypothetical protein